MLPERDKRFWLRPAGWVVWVVAASCCGPALAHADPAEHQLFWTGAVHLLTSVLSVSSLLALVAAAAGQEDVWTLCHSALAAGAAAAFVVLPDALPPTGVYALLVLLGLVAAAGWKVGPLAGAGAAVAAGAAAGAAADADALTTQLAAGAGLSAGFLVLAGMTALNGMQSICRFQAVVAIARRVAGSWIAAIGLLMAALAFRLHG